MYIKPNQTKHQQFSHAHYNGSLLDNVVLVLLSQDKNKTKKQQKRSIYQSAWLVISEQNTYEYQTLLWENKTAWRSSYQLNIWDIFTSQRVCFSMICLHSQPVSTLNDLACKSGKKGNNFSWWKIVRKTTLPPLVNWNLWYFVDIVIIST